MKQLNAAPPYIGEGNLAIDKYDRPASLLDNPDAIVIGSGIGGLGIAALLARRKGYRVLVLEANDVPGGCMHCHEMGGFEFNSGIDSIGDMDPKKGRGILRPTIDYLTENRLQWAEMPDMHEIAEFAGDQYPFYSNPDKNKAWMKERFGDDVKVDEMLKLEERVEAAVTGWALTKILPEWFPHGLKESLHQTIGKKWIDYLGKSVNDVLVGELGFPEKLASVMGYMYGNYGAIPAKAPFAFHAINLFHYRYGAYYPVGGPSYIVECIVPTIENRGGQVAVKCRVDEILVEGNTAVGVRLDDGTVINSRLVISDASAYTTFMDLLPRNLSKMHGYPPKFDDLGPSPVHMYYFLGYDDAPDLPAHIVWHLPAYDIDAADAKYRANMDFEGGQACYILCPSGRDPAFKERYGNKGTVLVLAEAPGEWVERQKTDPAFKAELIAKMEAHFHQIVEHHIPQLKGKTPTFKEAGLPINCNPWSWKHCSYGAEGTKRRFVDHTNWMKPRTKIDGLYLSGQDAFAPGFSGAMLGSRACYTAITGNLLFMARPGIGSFP